MMSILQTDVPMTQREDHIIKGMRHQCPYACCMYVPLLIASKGLMMVEVVFWMAEQCGGSERG